MSEGEKKPPKKSAYSLLQTELNKMIKHNNKQNNAAPSKVGSASASTSSKNNTNEKSNADKDKVKEEKEASTSNSQEPKDHTVPDRSMGDLFCKICDSHMNSMSMWKSHVTGKRHLKNVKKGDSDPKYDELDVESDLKYEMRNVKDPIVGLNYIHEIRRFEQNAPSYFNCFLCHASLSTPALVIEHVISLKHRLNYIKEQSPSEYELIAATNLKKGHIQPLVHEAALKLEEKFGRGSVKVKQEKPKKTVSATTKRHFESDDEDIHSKVPKNQKSDGNEPLVWKSVDTVRKLSGRENEFYHKKMTYNLDKDDFRRRPDSPKTNSRNPRERSYSPSKSYSRDYRDRSLSLERDKYSKKSDPIENRYPRSYEPLPHNEDHLPKPRKDNFKRNSSPEQYYPTARYPRSYEPPPENNEDNFSKSRKDDKQNSSPEQYFPTASSFQAEAPLLPHEKAVKDPFDPNELKDFVQKIFALPADMFLKITLHKMDNLNLKGIDELTLLLRLMHKVQDLIYKKIPPEMQSMLKQRFNNAENVSHSPAPVMASPRESSSMETIIKPSTSQEKQPDLSFIRDILNSANITTNPSPSTSTASFQNASDFVTSFQNTVANLFQMQNSNLLQSQNLNSFQKQATNSFEKQPSTAFLNQAGSSLLNQPSTSLLNQPSTSLLNQPSTSFLNQAGISLLNQRSASFQNQAAASFTNQLSAAFQNQPSTSSQNQNSPRGQNPNSFSASTQVNIGAKYPNQTNPAPAPASYLNQPQSYNYSSSSSYYNSSQINQSSPSIPGLTLTEDEKPESQSYNSYLSKYSSNNSDGKQNYPYRY